MKKLMPFVFFAVIIAVIFSDCVLVNFTDFNSVTGKGNLEKYEFKVGEYNRVRVEGFCDIRYYTAASDTITLEVQPNLFEYYIIEVIADELVIRTKKRVSFDTKKTPILTVSTPVLNQLTLSGAGTFTAYDKINADSFDLRMNGAGKAIAEFNVNSLSVDLSGAGSFELSGSANIASFTMSGTGDLAALPLQTREAVVNLSGTGSISISCSEKLLIRASGMGSVSYRGSPNIDLNNSGLVSIRQVY